MTRVLAYLAAALALLAAPLAHAAFGDPDCSFGTNGQIRIDSPGTFGSVFALTPTADGGVLTRVGGQTTISSLFGVDIDGTRLTPIQASAGILSDSSDVVQADGSVLYVTGFGDMAGGSAGIRRITPAGAVDTAFGAGGKATVAGASSFGTGPVLQSDGRILAAGGVNGAAALVRFTADGAPDPSFGTGGIATNAAAGQAYQSIAFQPDGSILALGFGMLARHRSDGSLDSSFGFGGSVSLAQVFAQAFFVRLQPSGASVVVGRLSNGNIRIARFRSYGALDTSIASGAGFRDIVVAGVPMTFDPLPWRSVAMMADGRVLVAGSAGGGRFIVRYGADLTDDGALNVSATALAPLPDGRIWLGDGYGALGGSMAGISVSRVLGDDPGPACAATSVTMSTSPNPSQIFQTVTLTAAVTSSGVPVPDGIVRFMAAQTELARARVANGIATASTSLSFNGTRSFTAVYGPSAGYAASTSVPVTHFVGGFVDPAPGSISVFDSGASSAFGATNMTFNAVLYPPQATSVSVGFATHDDSAIAGVDYTATSGTLTFNAGESAKTISVPIMGKSVPTVTKRFAVSFSNSVGHAAIRSGTANGSIVYGNVGMPAPRATGGSQAEGHGGLSLLPFTVSLGGGVVPPPRDAPVPPGGIGGTSMPVSVDYATADGTGIAGIDYIPQSGTLTFAPGQVTRTVFVPIIGNTTPQTNRTVVLKLSNTIGAPLPEPVASDGVGTIVDDDPVQAASPVAVYRLYSGVTQEHHYTTDANEYAVLPGRGWQPEGRSYAMFANAGIRDEQYTIPMHRLYHTGVQQHLWTTDASEVMYQVQQGGWLYEGVAGYVLPSPASGTTPLYRLYLANPPLHLWTTDAAERDVLSGQRGWTYEGIAGYVLP